VSHGGRDDPDDVAGPTGSDHPKRGRNMGNLLRRSHSLGWGVGDQALSSLTNFALGLITARTVTAYEFGAFSLAFATFTAGLGLARALTSEPLSVRFSGVDEQGWARATSWAAGSSLVVGTGFGLACVVAGLLLPGALGDAVLAVGILMPGLLLQDTWRFAFFARGWGAAAFVNDFVWAIALIPSLGAAVLLTDGSVSVYILAWAAAASVAAVFGAKQAGVIPRPTAARRWFLEQRDIGPRFVLEFLAINGSTQLSAYGIGVIAGLTAAGAIRGGMILMGPLYVLVMGLRMAAVPDLVRALKRSTRAMRRRSLALSAGLGGLALVWTLSLSILPPSIGISLLGPTWEGTASIILPISLWMVGLAVSVPATAGVRALLAVKKSLAARLVVALFGVMATLVGAGLEGAVGAAWGMACASLVGATVWWLQLHRAIIESESAGDDRRAAADD
jgi:O-antigen/teichoic acid export membrane protein